MRLREDPSTPRALRLALEDDPCEFPSAEALGELADVVDLRLCHSEPLRLALRADTPGLLLQALREGTPPAAPALVGVWEGVRKAVATEPLEAHRCHASTSQSQGRQVAPSAAFNDPYRNRSRQARPSHTRRRPRMVLVATGVVLVSSLAAAGFGLFHTVRFSAEVAERPTPLPSGAPKSQSVRKASSSLNVQQVGATNPPMAPDARALTTLEPGAVETRPGGGGSPLTAHSAAVLKAPATALPRPTEEGEANPRDVGSVVAEISLLRPAWTELRAGRPQAAVAIAREHAARYPTGALAQEREVVLIQALDQLGHKEEAKRQAEHFEQTFPDSPHRPQVHLGEPSP